MTLSKREIDFSLVAALICGIFVFALKCRIALPIESIGGTDSASHAEMAQNLIHGKGFSEDFIQYSHFFSPLQYPEITHPAADYQPLYSLLVAPFFLIFGKSAFAAKIPAMLIGSVFLPLILYLLTARVSGNRFTGLAAALAAIAFPEFFRSSLRCDDDLLFAFMILASCFFIMKAEDSPKHFYAAGLIIALTFYAKGTGLLLIPIYILLFILRRGFRAFADKRLRACFLLAFGVLLPWFIRNTIHFGNPMYSNAIFASGYIGYKDWETETYRLYPDGKRPSLFSKLRDAGPKEVWRKTKQFFKTYLSWSFVGPEQRDSKYHANQFYTSFIGIPALIGFILFFGSHLYKRFISRGFADSALMRWHNQDIFVLLLVNFSLMTFLAICWEPQKRQTLPFVMLNMVVGWTTLFFVVQQICKWMKISIRLASIVIGIIMFAVVIQFATLVYVDYKNKSFPYGEGDSDWMEAGRWLKHNAPGSITMAREPSQLHFYSEQKAVQIPLSELDETIKVMEYYKVTHLIPFFHVRPSLKALVESETGSARLVYDKGVQIYEINFDDSRSRHANRRLSRRYANSRALILLEE